MLISCFTPLIRIIYGIPLARHRRPGNLSVRRHRRPGHRHHDRQIRGHVRFQKHCGIATVMVVGIGGQYAFGGNIPFFGIQIPCIAGAAIAGIVLNLLLSIGKREK